MKQGWEIKQLGEVCNLTGGGTPSKKIEEYYDGNILWATIRDMNEDILYATEHKITQIGLDNSSSNIIPKDNVIIATRVGLGKVCFLLNDTAINQDLKGIIPKNEDEIFNMFLFWWFKNISEQIVKAGTGATVQGVKISFIQSLQFPLPPLDEQKRIVAKLDECFDAIDKARANVEKNLNNAKELFQSQLNQIFSQPALSEAEGKGDGWVEKKLGEVCNLIGGGTPSKKVDEYFNGDILWATVRDMNEDILYTTDHKITQIGLDNSSSNIIPKDNVIIATRVGLGKVCFLINDTAINQDLKGIIPKNTDAIDNLFLFWWFKNISEQIVKAGTGATVQGVKIPFIQSLQFPLPPLVEQKRIVKNLDELKAQTQSLESNYQQELDALDELKKSILQKAFMGEL